MTTQHNIITDPDLHEPKGISTALDRQVYLADGAQGGSWRNSAHNVHGDAIIVGSTTATSTTAAGDATLSTDSDYVKVVAGWSLAHATGITLDVDKLVVSVAGDYIISLWASIKVPATNNFVGMKYSINDTVPHSTRKIISQSTSTNDYLNLSATGIVASLSAGDSVSIYIASTKTDNIIIQECGLVVYLLDET